MTDARRARARRDSAADRVNVGDQEMKRWLILMLVGILVAVGAPALWLANRPDAAVGAPVAGPAQTGRTTVTATTSGPAGLISTATPSTRTAATSPPQRLAIPALGIDAPIDPEGVDQNGAMALPDDVRRVGWYRFNPAPGAAAGSVVISGHVDSAEQGKGAMFTLGSANVGDRITVRSADGSRHVYRVTGRQTIVKKRLPVEQLFDRTGPPRLILITCGGPFITSLHSYRDNLVVAAEPEPGT
jgi:sortase (surface protein transpeptidase)